MPETKLHADASPSSSEIWINCPASVTKARGRVRQPTIYTREGTAAHRIAEMKLTTPRKKLPKAILVDGEDVPITEEMLDAVEQYVRYVKDAAKYADLHVETRVQIPIEGEDLFGTSDAFIIADRHIEIIDYKHGRGYAVDPTAPQFKLYALGVLEHVGMFTDIKTVTLTVVQPRAEGETIKSLTFPIENLIAWEREVFQPAVARLVANDQEEIPGEHCRWCVRAGECQGLANLMSANALVAFDDLPPDPVGMNDEELSQVLSYGQMISQWLLAIRAEVSRRIEAGQTVPGWKLVPKRATRKWDDPDGALVELEMKGLAANEVMRIETIGVVEKALKRHGFKPDSIYGYTVKESSGSTLVSEKDGRPAIPTGADVFGELPQIPGSVQ